MNLELHSQRLILTPYTPDDLDLSLLMWTDPAVVKHAGEIMSESAIKKNMPNWTKRGGDGYIGIWTVSDRKTGEKYGSAALLPMPVEEDHTDYSLVVPGKVPIGDIEIGYFLKPSAWGFGYATEACRRLLQFAFQETPLRLGRIASSLNSGVYRRLLIHFLLCSEKGVTIFCSNFSANQQGHRLYRSKTRLIGKTTA